MGISAKIPQEWRGTVGEVDTSPGILKITLEVFAEDLWKRCCGRKSICMSASKEDSEEVEMGRTWHLQQTLSCWNRMWTAVLLIWGQRPLPGAKCPQEVPLAWFSILVQ